MYWWPYLKDGRFGQIEADGTAQDAAQAQLQLVLGRWSDHLGRVFCIGVVSLESLLGRFGVLVLADGIAQLIDYLFGDLFYSLHQSGSVGRVL